MIVRPRLHWFRLLFVWRGSVLPYIANRLLLVLALLTPQPILILDEPFDGFDLRQTLHVMDLLREVATERALILSIHQLKDAERICDRLLLLAAALATGQADIQRLGLQLGLQLGLSERFAASVQCRFNGLFGNVDGCAPGFFLFHRELGHALHELGHATSFA